MFFDQPIQYLKKSLAFTVEGIGFDDLVSKFDLLPPDLIKIDIEGAEEFVVPAMENTLQKHHPALPGTIPISIY